MTTSSDIVNQALQMIGNNMPPVTGSAPNFDTSAAGIAAARLYVPCVATVARQFGWDFSRATVTLTPTPNVAPFPWAVQYVYPAAAVEVWQLMPATLTDPNNPLPVNFVVANDQVSGTQARVINTNLAGALAVINNNPAESTWDSLFREAVVRLLASEFAIAISGKPDTAQGLLESGAAFETLGESRQG